MLTDLELSPHGERHDEAVNRIGLRREGISGSDHLHARSAFGKSNVNDPIVDEVRRIRDEYAARFNNDIDAMFQDIKEQERKSGRTFVSYAKPTSTPEPEIAPAAEEAVAFVP